MKSSVSLFKIKTIIFWSLNRSMGNFYPCRTSAHIIIISFGLFVFSLALSLYLFHEKFDYCHCQQPETRNQFSMCGPLKLWTHAIHCIAAQRIFLSFEIISSFYALLSTIRRQFFSLLCSAAHVWLTTGKKRYPKMEISKRKNHWHISSKWNLENEWLKRECSIQLATMF